MGVFVGWDEEADVAALRGAKGRKKGGDRDGKKNFQSESRGRARWGGDGWVHPNKPQLGRAGWLASASPSADIVALLGCQGPAAAHGRAAVVWGFGRTRGGDFGRSHGRGGSGFWVSAITDAPLRWAPVGSLAICDSQHRFGCGRLCSGIGSRHRVETGRGEAVSSSPGPRASRPPASRPARRAAKARPAPTEAPRCPT